MTKPGQNQSYLPGCQTLVPPELQDEGLCVLHFILSVEHASAEMRCEIATEKANATRRLEIAHYIKIAAMKLSEVGVGDVPLSDALKRRILTTPLTLMILRESLVRSAIHCVAELRIAKAPVAAVPGHSQGTLLRRVRA